MCRIAVCNECGKEFTPRCPKGPAPKTCYACRSRVCLYCGITFDRQPKHDAAKDAGLYCTKAHYFAAVKAGTQRFRGFLRGLDWQLASWFEEWDAQRPQLSKCRYCGAQAYGNVYCSDVCSSRWHHFSKKPSECVECGKSLAGLMYQSRSMCAKCRNRRKRRLKKELRKKYNFLRKVRNRCKHYGVAYDPAVKARLVFERDGFRCQICGAACLERFRLVGDAPHLLSPTVDHIVPLSWRRLGHTWDNVQCACWQCNVRKNNKFAGQTRLLSRVR